MSAWGKRRGEGGERERERERERESRLFLFFKIGYKIKFTLIKRAVCFH